MVRETKDIWKEDFEVYIYGVVRFNEDKTLN